MKNKATKDLRRSGKTSNRKTDWCQPIITAIAESVQETSHTRDIAVLSELLFTFFADGSEMIGNREDLSLHFEHILAPTGDYEDGLFAVHRGLDVGPRLGSQKFDLRSFTGPTIGQQS